MIDLLSVLQADQLTVLLRQVVLVPDGLDNGESTKWMIGIALMIMVGLVVLGGIKRIAEFASE